MKGKPVVSSFSFDRVFDKTAPQQLLYEACVKVYDLDAEVDFTDLDSLLFCRFWRATTAASLRMDRQGPERRTPSLVWNCDSSNADMYKGGQEENRGIIPRASEEIFNYIGTQSHASSKFLVRASFLQVSVMITFSKMTTRSTMRRCQICWTPAMPSVMYIST